MNVPAKRNSICSASELSKTKSVSLHAGLRIKGQHYWLTCLPRNGDIFVTAWSYKKGLTVGSHFIVEINDLFTEIVTLQFYKADIIILRIKYQNSDRSSTV